MSVTKAVRKGTIVRGAYHSKEGETWKEREALVWWNQVFKHIRRGRRDHYESWVSLKRMMRERFVLSYYIRDLYNKLQRLYQGSKSVEKYHKEMEMDLMRAQIEETRNATMARFLHGPYREI
ncbi:hypothetical protein CR513_00498, partial [Mucuna pruriens]